MPGYQPRHDTDPVWFNGQQVNTLTVASAQTGVRITAVYGWDERPDVRDVRELRSGQDGEYADNLYLGGRTITIEGEVYGSSWVNLQSRKRTLAALFNPSSTEALLKIPDPAIYAASYEAFATATDPVAYWPLDDTVGSGTADDPVGGFDGTLAGNPVFGATGGVWDGSTSLDFDGTGDYVERAYSASLNPSTFTVAAWVCRDSDTGATEFIATSSDNTANTGWRMFVSSSDTVQFSVGSGASISGSVSTTTLTAGTWYHVVGRYDGTSTSIAINGVVEDTDAKTYSANTTQALRIGARDGSTSNLFNGKMQHVALWNRALTTSEISQLYDYDSAAYATTGMTGYERVSARVVEAIQFGDTLDPACQVWQVVLRASDPRVYSDTATSTDSGTSGTASRTVTVDQGGTYETPPTLTATGPTASTWSVAEPSSGLSLAMDGVTLAASETVAFNTLDRTATLTASYNGTRVRDSRLIAGWMLSETSGSTADNYQGSASLDLTYTGGFTLNQSGPAAGIASVDLNGSTGYLVSSATSSLFSLSFTVEAWVYRDSSTGDDVIFSLSGAGASDDVLISVNSSGVVSGTCTISGGGATFGTAPGAVPSLAWRHVVATYDNNARLGRVYVNGVDATTSQTAGAATRASSSVTLELGRVPSTGHFDGKIGPVAYFNAALSAAEVADLYASATSATVDSSAYRYLVSSSSRWANLGTGSSVYTLSSSGLNTGSKLNVTYRDARL